MKFLYTEQAPEAVGPYSQGTEAMGMIFTSGQLPIFPETGELISDDIKKATLQSLKNVENILESVGSSAEKIVKVNIYLTDMNDFSAMNEVYAEFFGEHKPARSCVEVSKLPKDGIIEIEAIALK
ncbi:endoribonuclease L-PSP [Peptoniphilus sp. ING2-D1G]|nr:endoribonuclease L-PSP [Peptoniphilus sp. ING2-D1G]